MNDFLTKFKPLISILELCPDDVPLATVDWDKDDQDLEIEWYFRDGNYVQLCIGESFGTGSIYFRYGDEIGRCDYTPELLTKYLEEWSNRVTASEQPTYYSVPEPDPIPTDRQVQESKG